MAPSAAGTTSGDPLLDCQAALEERNATAIVLAEQLAATQAQLDATAAALSTKDAEMADLMAQLADMSAQLDQFDDLEGQLNRALFQLNATTRYLAVADAQLAQAQLAVDSLGDERDAALQAGGERGRGGQAPPRRLCSRPGRLGTTAPHPPAAAPVSPCRGM